MSTRLRAPLLLCAATCALFLPGCHHNEAPLALPKPGTSVYVDAIKTFNVALASLESRDRTRAASQFLKFTKLVPGEAAGWTNLAIAHLQLSDTQAATKELAKAKSVAPESLAAPIIYLSGITASSLGNLDEAIADYRKAIQLDSKDLRARYGLISELERQADPSSQAEILKLISEIIAENPSNIFANLEAARLSIPAGNKTMLQVSLRNIKAVSANWAHSKLSTSPMPYFHKLDSPTLAPREMSLVLVHLENVLGPDLVFQKDRRALTTPDPVGPPITRLFSLAMPVPVFDPPDAGLAYHESALGTNTSGGKAQWVGATAINPTGNSVAVTSDGAQIQIQGGATIPLGSASAANFGVTGHDSIAAFNFTNDGFIDFASAQVSGFSLYRQNRDGTFHDVTSATHIPTELIKKSYSGVWAADIDLDGDLDLVLGVPHGPTVALQNNADGTFKPLTAFAGVKDVRAFCWADLDADGANDGIFIDGSDNLHILANQRSGRFLSWPVPVQTGKVVAISAADIEGLGRLQLVCLRADGSIFTLTGATSCQYAQSDWTIKELTRWNAIGTLTPGASHIVTADLDNNGTIDIIASSQQGSAIWLSDASGSFAPLAAKVDFAVCAVADLNGDGLLDLVGINTDGKCIEATASGTKNYHWQDLRCQAAPVKKDATKSGDQRINSYGIGGTITVRCGLMIESQQIEGPIVHLGLGSATSADLIRFVWPDDGIPAHVQSEFALNSNTIVNVTERLDGSCPWVFTNNGKQISFIGDFLWRSPLGLRINAQATAGVAMSNEWLKIRGDQLAPIDGSYDVRITAELWETHFFDQVSLMVVDHPASTAINVDDRFAIPPPPNRIYVTDIPRPLARAVDDNGADVSAQVRTVDGVYLDTFGRGEYQGVTRDHYVEGEVDPTEPTTGTLYLIATGWIHPTNSSINVAISQGKHEAPRAISLEVADSKGGWKVARPNIGFPCGKVKSIVIRLDDAFVPGAPRKFRLRTNLEIYWDALATAAAAGDSKAHAQRIELSSAALRYRGFSRIDQANESSPETPDYSDIEISGSKWLDLTGYYTRFGDVRELLTKIDDRYVIMNAGDEMRLKFPALAAPPASMVRDFILIGEGWEKDGNLNTTFSKTVLPLPSHRDPSYSRPPTRLEDDPVYKRYPEDWVTYHTRYVTPEGFHEAILGERGATNAQVKASGQSFR